MITIPNHVRNVWKIKNIPPEKINHILNKLSRTLKSDDTRIIDFDLIIPEPKFKQDCPKEYRLNNKSHSYIETDDNRSWFNWYDWHIYNWGTKWNAYDGYTIIEDTQITFVFSTAWSFPRKIANELTKLHCDLTLLYADEDIGINCGEIKYYADEGRWHEKFADEIDNAEQFANDIWRY